MRWRDRRPRPASGGNWSAPTQLQAGTPRTSTRTSPRNSWNARGCDRPCRYRARQAPPPARRLPHRSGATSRICRPRPTRADRAAGAHSLSAYARGSSPGATSAIVRLREASLRDPRSFAPHPDAGRNQHEAEHAGDGAMLEMHPRHARLMAREKARQLIRRHQHIDGGDDQENDAKQGQHKLHGYFLMLGALGCAHVETMEVQPCLSRDAEPKQVRMRGQIFASAHANIEPRFAAFAPRLRIAAESAMLLLYRSSATISRIMMPTRRILVFT